MSLSRLCLFLLSAINMSEFNAKEFCELNVMKPDLDAINQLKKTELYAVGKHLQLDVKMAQRKSELKQVILEHMVDECLIDESNLKSQDPVVTDVHTKQMQYDYEIRMKEMEIRLKECELEKERLIAGRARSEYFDVSKHIKLLPKFDEKYVDQFFVQFEKLAEQCKWPTDSWVLLIQTAFIGRAQVVYASLDKEESDYEVIKSEILKAYELVPEAHRQKFRSL